MVWSPSSPVWLNVWSNRQPTMSSASCAYETVSWLECNSLQHSLQRSPERVHPEVKHTKLSTSLRFVWTAQYTSGRVLLWSAIIVEFFYKLLDWSKQFMIGIGDLSLIFIYSTHWRLSRCLDVAHVSIVSLQSLQKGWLGRTTVLPIWCWNLALSETTLSDIEKITLQMSDSVSLVSLV